EGYHGYWPLESRAAEPRIGGEAALDRLVARGHDAGLALILDLVPNHVYEDNARYRDHLDWFGPPGCVCGTPSCPWSEHIQTCWFTPYLPDVDWPVREARDAAIEDARFWSRRFDLDGFRIDAVPMMPRGATRRVADATRRLEPGSEASFLLGEVFTGPGEGALGALRYYLGPAGLDAVFDFPLMWAIHDVIGRDTGRFGDIDGLLAVEEQTFGPASLARILDNHDTVRFLSVAEGDAGGDPWDAPAVQPIDETPYRRLMLAQALVFTLPGIPVLYQGDEVGVAGGGDPDNRRVLPGDDALSAIQGEVLEFTQRLGQLRRCSEALRRGARTPLSTASHRYAFRRDGERPVVVVLETEGASGDFTLPTGSLTPGEWVDLVSGESLTSDGSPIALDAAPGRARVLVRADDPCAAIWAE
ncbi:MAG: hypothetical protein KC731_36750, partial [Myxococcales bacterium]|nr:hypothetical protein [Myxococcales bacterium]